MLYQGKIVDDPNEAASDEVIAQIQQMLGTNLPDDYLQFLRVCNGGGVDYEVSIEFEDSKSEYLGFGSVYEAVVGGDYESNPFELEQLYNWEGFPPKGVLPIARDGGDSLLFLDLRDGYQVTAFVRGLPEWTGLRQQDALVHVADSFDDYWSKLVIPDSTVQDFIENFDPKYGNAELAAEWLDTGNSDWRTKFAEEWKQHVLSHGS